MKYLLLIMTVCFACTVSFGAAGQNNALFSLQNLERERASFLATFTDVSLSTEARQQKVQGIYRRLADIERMVLRDERIANSDKMLVQKAFANYELTFLVHASAEHHTQPLAQWLNTLAINASSIAQSKQGYR